MFMDNIKLFTKMRKNLKPAGRIYSQDIRIKFGTEKMCHAYNEKRNMTNDGKK